MIREETHNTTSLFHSEYFKNVTTLISGSASAQIIPLLASPFIARLYSPNDYAVLAAYMSVTTLIAMAATGSYDAALMLDCDDYDALNTGAVAIIITFIITAVSCIGVISFRESIARITGNQEVSFWLCFLPLTVFCIGANQTLMMWNNRQKRYKRLAFNRIVLSFCITTMTLTFGYIGLKEKGLLTSMIMGNMIAFLVLFGQTVCSDQRFLPEIKLARLRQSFIKHKDFLAYNMPQVFLDGVRESSILLIISNYFGAYALGSFSFAKNMFMAPLQVLGGAVSQVYYERASKYFNRTGSIWHITKWTYISVATLSMPFFLAILFFGDSIFSLVFGSKWTHAGEISQILAIWLFLRFTTSTISTIPLILGRQKAFFIISIMFSLLPIAILLLTSCYSKHFFFVLLLFVVVSSSLLLTVNAWFYRLTHDNH